MADLPNTPGDKLPKGKNSHERLIDSKATPKK